MGEDRDEFDRREREHAIRIQLRNEGINENLRPVSRTKEQPKQASNCRLILLFGNGKVALLN